MGTWKPVATGEEIDRIRSEYDHIRAHLGPEAPDPSEAVEILRNDDGDFKFVVGQVQYEWVDDNVMRHLPSPEGTERMDFWRNGEITGSAISPPPRWMLAADELDS